MLNGMPTEIVAVFEAGGRTWTVRHPGIITKEMWGIFDVSRPPVSPQNWTRFTMAIPPRPGRQDDIEAPPVPEADIIERAIVALCDAGLLTATPAAISEAGRQLLAVSTALHRAPAAVEG
jgi:hypothetical protein